MALQTYSQLIDAVSTELNLSSSRLTTPAIKDAITRAEAKINRNCRLREMEQLAFATYPDTAAVAAGYPRLLPLPPDYLEMTDLRIKKASAADITYEEVVYVDPSRIWQYYDNESDPYRFYYTLRDQLEFNKEASENHTVMMHYYKRFDIEENQTNWLLTNFPDVYLYGALTECEMHVRNDERMPMWSTFFEKAVREMNEMDERGRDDEVLDLSEQATLASRHTYRVIRDR